MSERRNSWTMRSFGPGAMQRRPVAAIWLAEVSNAWAMVEAVLANFIEYMISEPYLTDRTRALDPLGMKLFGTFQTFNQRWGLMVAVLESRLSKDELSAIKRRLKNLRAKLTAASNKRNDLVHSIYGVEVEYEMRDGKPEYSDVGDYLLKSKPYTLVEDSLRGHKPVEEDYIQSVVNGIRSARGELEEFIERVKRRKTTPLKGTQASIAGHREKANNQK